MKKILSIFIIFIMAVTLGCGQIFAETLEKKMNANIKTKRVPAGTIISLKLLDPVSSSTMAVGDRFDMMVINNVIVNNEIVIPQGSVIRGSIEEVQSPKMLYKGGIIRLYFDHIVSSTGKQVPFYAGIYRNPNVTIDGALRSNTNYMTAFDKTLDTTKNIVVKPTTWAWDKGDELWNGTPKYVMAPITAVVCTPVAGIYFIGDSIVNIFKKGEDISLNQGDTLQVQLIKPIDMPAY